MVFWSRKWKAALWEVNDCMNTVYELGCVFHLKPQEPMEMSALLCKSYDVLNSVCLFLKKASVLGLNLAFQAG